MSGFAFIKFIHFVISVLYSSLWRNIPMYSIVDLICLSVDGHLNFSTFWLFKKIIYLYIWLHPVLVAACRIVCCISQTSLQCGVWTFSMLSFSMWDLSFPLREETDIPYIGRWILNHWATREVRTFLALWTELLWTFMYKFLFEYVFNSPGSVYPRVELLDRMVTNSMFLTV